MELEKGKSKSSIPSKRSKATKKARFVLCVIETEGVEKGKVYRVVTDPFARQHKLIPIVDDADADYVLPAANFVAVTTPTSAEKRLPRPASAVRRSIVR